MSRTVLDWSGRERNSTRAPFGPRKPCYICKKGAFLRHPESGKPCHKVCVEEQIDRSKTRKE